MSERSHAVAFVLSTGGHKNHAPIFSVRSAILNNGPSGLLTSIRDYNLSEWRWISRRLRVLRWDVLFISFRCESHAEKGRESEREVCGNGGWVWNDFFRIVEHEQIHKLIRMDTFLVFGVGDGTQSNGPWPVRQKIGKLEIFYGDFCPHSTLSSLRCVSSFNNVPVEIFFPIFTPGESERENERISGRSKLCVPISLLNPQSADQMRWNDIGDLPSEWNVEPAKANTSNATWRRHTHSAESKTRPKRFQILIFRLIPSRVQLA